jgi:hypothetical protein
MPGTTIIPLVLPNGRTVLARVRTRGEAEVAFAAFDFQRVADDVAAIASSLAEALRTVRPSKTALEFAVELTVEGGHLMALIAKGSGKASLKITLTWDGRD